MNDNGWIINQFEELIMHLECELTEDFHLDTDYAKESYPDDPLVKDIQALEAAIEILKSYEPVKHAHWWINCDGYYPCCSACNSEPPGREMSRYCPNCGRRMVTPERSKS